MPVHLVGEPEEVWMERGRRNVGAYTPTEEQLTVARSAAWGLTAAEAKEQLHNLLWSASARQAGKVTTVRLFGSSLTAIQIDGWPIGRVSGGRGKRERVKALVKEHYQERAARMAALDHRLSVSERQEFDQAEQALNKLTPPEARRLIQVYLERLDRREKLNRREAR